MFKKIEADNLFSWAHLEYEIESGVTLIDGMNHDDQTSEGAGKSSVTNSICWVCYGRVPNPNVKVDEVIREGEKSGGGVVTLDSGHKIKRQRSPHLLEIYNPDGQVVRGKDSRETQKLIDELLGMSFDTFCQSVYFAQNYDKKFVTAREDEKAKILSEILDLTPFDRALKTTKDRLKKSKAILATTERDFQNAERFCGECRATIEGLESTIEVFEESKEERLADFRARIEAKVEEIQELDALIESTDVSLVERDLSATETMLADLQEKQVEARSDLKNLQVDAQRRQSLAYRLTTLKQRITRASEQVVDAEESLKELEPDSPTCPTCGGEFSDDRHLVKFEKKRKAAERRLEESIKDHKSLKKERKKVKAELEALPEPRGEEQIKDFLSEIAEEQSNLKRRQQSLEKELAAYQSAQSVISKLVEQIEELESKMEVEAEKQPKREKKRLKEVKLALKQETEELNKFKAILEKETALQAKLECLKDGFKEVKSYVFRNLLSELSLKATEILTTLFEVPVSIRFYNDGEEGEGVSKILSDVTIFGKSRSLGLYSGGQFRRIQLAVDLALAKTVANRSNKPINFRVFDEPFQHLSESSMVKLVHLFEGLGGSTLLIEHNSIVKSIVNQTFTVELKDGVTSAV